MAAMGFVAAVLDWFGIVVFALTGALVASRKQMDVLGFALLGTVTGIGGGTIRDLLLAVPVFWVREPVYLLVCVAVSVVVYFTAHIPESRYRLLLWIDAVGLAAVSVFGAAKGLAAGAGPVVAVAMGIMTATFGGMIRDVLGGESPLILRRDVYITAALAGAGVFVALAHADGIPPALAAVTGFLVALGLRWLALWFGWSLPVYKPRRARTPEELGL